MKAVDMWKDGALDMCMWLSLNEKGEMVLYKRAALNELISIVSNHIAVLERSLPGDVRKIADSKVASLSTGDLSLLRRVQHGLNPLPEQAMNVQVSPSRNHFTGIRVERSAESHDWRTNCKPGARPGQPGNFHCNLQLSDNSKSHIGDNCGYNQSSGGTEKRRSKECAEIRLSENEPEPT